MNTELAERLAAAGVELLPQPAPKHPYEIALRAGDVLYLSGKTAMRDGKVVYTGRVGAESSLEDAKSAAALCATQVLSALEATVGLENVAAMLKVTVFVASAPGFVAQPEVANVASRLFLDVLGDAGRHTRSAVGVAMLPGDSTVEIEAAVLLTSGGAAA